MNQIVAVSHGKVSVIVNVHQFANNGVPARFGCRVVDGTGDSVSGLTQKPVNFAACTTCGAVHVHLGIIGCPMEYLPLPPEDPRAKLLMSIITETGNNGQWGRPMTGPARVVGLIEVHQAATLSEIGQGNTCSLCS